MKQVSRTVILSSRTALISVDTHLTFLLAPNTIHHIKHSALLDSLFLVNTERFLIAIKQRAKKCSILKII